MPNLKMIATIGSRLIDTENFKSKTNAATGLGGVLGSAALFLQTIPEPNAQIAAGVLGLASLICLWYKAPQGASNE